MMHKTIKKLLNDHQGAHSNFQIENFIVGCSGDTWAQYKQALREIESRYDIILDKREKLILQKSKIDKFSRSINGDGRKKKMYGMLAANYNKSLKSAIETRREIESFVELAVKLKEKIGDIDPEKRYQLESESWKNKGLKMAAIDILATGRVSHQTYDFIFSLPKKSQLELFKKLSIKKPFELLGFEPNELRAIGGVRNE